MDESPASSCFLVNVTGEIESAEFVGIDNLYCKFCFAYGQDWQVAAGFEDGISQSTNKSIENSQLFVWNLPLEITFKSTNVFGWPQLVVSTYGLDFFGNDVVRGYGSVHIPPISGMHQRRISLFAPDSSSLLQRLTSLFTGRRPEFVDPKVVSQAEGREVIRVRSEGFVMVKLNVVLKDFKNHGFRA